MYNRWLITGGCGFIGISLIRKIKDIQPDSVILVLDNLSSGSKNDLEEVHYFRQVNPRLSPIINSHLFLSLVVGDIRNPDICKLCCQDIDIVVHLAANTRVLPSFENPRLDLEINVSGTFNMLEAARQNNVKRFILASRSPSFDNNGHWADGQIFPRPVTPHEASKLACEGYCSAYFRSFGLKTISLCFSNVYGPGSSNKSSVISQFIRRATSGRACEIYGDGDQRRDFIFIDDLTDAIIKAALFQEPNPYPQSLIGSGITLSCAIDHKPSVFPW